MSKEPTYMPFYAEDWLAEKTLKLCEKATKGIWMDALAIMWTSDTRGVLAGTPQNLQRLLECSPGDYATFISDLKEHKIADISESNGTVTIINRRMYRQELARQKNKMRVRKYRGIDGNEAVANDYPDDFEEFWSYYPKDVEKKAAYRCWSTRLKQGVEPEDMIEAAKNYAEYCRVEKKEKNYIMAASRFVGRDEPYLDWLTKARNVEDDNALIELAEQCNKAIRGECPVDRGDDGKHNYCRFCVRSKHKPANMSLPFD